jgi:hypothetical protein
MEEALTTTFITNGILEAEKISLDEGSLRLDYDDANCTTSIQNPRIKDRVRTQGAIDSPIVRNKAMADILSHGASDAEPTRPITVMLQYANETSHRIKHGRHNEGWQDQAQMTASRPCSEVVVVQMMVEGQTRPNNPTS